MDVPDLGCRVSGHCPIHPSESPEKVREALSNALPGSEVRVGEHAARASAAGLSSLGRILETIRSRKSRAYLRHMRRNLDGDSTWFYLNKQAAFANSIALCDAPDESPLGPIRITLESGRIEQVMEWLAARRDQEN